MPLVLDELERRSAPAILRGVLGVRDGIVYAPNERDDYVPFSDFPAAHAVASDGVTYVVGAADGGGPRVQVRTDGVVTADFFAYEETFRDGVNVALGSGVVVTGAAEGGGPVVAVYDLNGNQISRFFAYGEDFRGGVSVAVAGDRIYTVPGPGGGPHVREWDFHGVELDSWFGDDPGRRDGWSLAVGDVTHDRVDDVILTAGRRIVINEGTTRGRQVVAPPDGYDLVGYGDGAMAVGTSGGYTRARALWTSFPKLIEFEFTDGAAGSPNPAPTTGFRPGVFRPPVTTGEPPPDDQPVRNLVASVAASGSVGTVVGTGTSFFPMVDDAGVEYVVTASHVAKYSPFGTIANTNPLVAPGRLDGVPQPVGDAYATSEIVPGVPYVVDASAFLPNPGVTVDRLVRLGDQSVAVDGVAEDVSFGDVAIAVGRGRFVGVGVVRETDSTPVPITWAPGVTPEIAGQIVVGRGLTQFAVPGFSGGLALRLSWTPEGVRREILGMVVAGNDYFTYVTPVGPIERALGLRVAI